MQRIVSALAFVLVASMISAFGLSAESTPGKPSNLPGQPPQSSVQAPPGSASPPPAAGSDYRVGAGDLLRVSVFDHAELAGDFRVSETGNITFPLLGQVPVAGMSTRDVESMLNRSLASGGFVQEPQITVLVVDFESQKVSVMGQVAKPGQYALTASEHVLDVLAQAGGVINLSAADDATLIRKDGSKVSVDLIRMFQGDPSQNSPVTAGDTLYVPRAPQFYVYGEVQHPGIYRLERRMTVSQAISAAGGLTPNGSEHWTVVKRRDGTGTEHKVSVSSADYLQADDVLLVKESLF